jgi:hypothetical protein
MFQTRGLVRPERGPDVDDRCHSETSGKDLPSNRERSCQESLGMLMEKMGFFELERGRLPGSCQARIGGMPRRLYRHSELRPSIHEEERANRFTILG